MTVMTSTELAAAHAAGITTIETIENEDGELTLHRTSPDGSTHTVTITLDQLLAAGYNPEHDGPVA